MMSLGTNIKLIKKITRISATLIVLGYIYFFLYNQYSQEIKIIPANVGTQSFSVAWSTSKPSKGCVVAIPENKIFQTKISCHRSERSPVHLQDFTLALPDTTYSIWLVSGVRVSRPTIKTLKTHPISDKQPSIPNPAYGFVINPYHAREEGALLVLTAQTPAFQYPLTTMSSENGTFSLDLSGFSDNPDSYRLEATRDGNIWNNRFVSADVVAPMPPIIVTTYVK